MRQSAGIPCNGRPLAKIEVSIAKNGGRHVEWGWKRRGRHRGLAAVWIQDREAKPRLAHKRASWSAYRIEKPAQSGTRTDQNVLAVVDLGTGLGVLKRVRSATEERPLLEQRHPAPGVGELKRRSHAGQPAAYNRYRQRARWGLIQENMAAAAEPRPDRSLDAGARCTSPRSVDLGSASIRSSKPR
jgi:hypothetical protein